MSQHSIRHCLAPCHLAPIQQGRGLRRTRAGTYIAQRKSSGTSIKIISLINKGIVISRFNEIAQRFTHIEHITWHFFIYYDTAIDLEKARLHPRRLAGADPGGGGGGGGGGGDTEPIPPPPSHACVLIHAVLTSTFFVPERSLGSTASQLPCAHARMISGWGEGRGLVPFLSGMQKSHETCCCVSTTLHSVLGDEG